MKSEELSLIDALSYAAKISLPEEYNPKGQPWVMAIVHVTKCNAKSNYAIAKNDGDGRPIIIKDYGEAARIMKVNHIYPYVVLSNMYVPDLRNHTDIVNYLSGRGYDADSIRFLLGVKGNAGEEKPEDIKKADKATVKGWVIREAIKNQLREIELKHSTEQDY